MPWFKVDDGFTNSKPVLKIPRRFRAAAVGLWTLAGAWSAKELTDGNIPEYLLEEFASTPAIAKHLVASGLWETNADGWAFVGWSKYQPTRAQVMADRDAEAERKRKYRESRMKTIVDDSSTIPAHSESEVHESTSKPRNENCTPPDLQESEMSQWDTGGTPTGRTVGHHPESGLPDPTRPDPTNKEQTTTTVVELKDPSASPPKAKTVEPYRQDVERLCEKLRDRIEANGNRSGRITNEWRKTARLLLDRDGVTETQAAYVIDWCQDDTFWQSNILSMTKLRKHYPQLAAKARETYERTQRTAPRGDSLELYGTPTRPAPGIGKPSIKAMGWQQAGQDLIREMREGQAS